MELYVIIWWTERNEQTEPPNAHRTNDDYLNSAEVSAQQADLPVLFASRTRHGRPYILLFS